MNDSTTFLPLNTNIGRQTKQIKNKETKCLTEDQAQHIYKKVESGNKVNIDTINQEMGQDFNILDDISGDINPYHKIIVNNVERQDTICLQIEQWSILSNMVNYIEYDRHPKNFYSLDIKAVGQKIYKKRQ